ncbi:MAG: hypothetical protein HY698_15710 [Deltaproteobacteria bacterium]|nr:hypothetical protein [Deltaproteobacteria bacterium]
MDTRLLSLIGISGLLSGACAAIDDDQSVEGSESELRARGSMMGGTGGLVFNDPPSLPQISKNGVSASDLDRLGAYRWQLTRYKLPDAQLAAPILAGSTVDGRAQKALAYVVDCALPASTWIVVGEASYEGRLGLASEWGSGTCEGACQRLVSACVFAHLNGRSVQELVSMRIATGATSVPSTSDMVSLEAGESAGYPYAEAAFWGNYFTGSDWRAGENACLVDVARASLRRCNGDSTCTRAIRGACASTCTSRDGSNGAYYRCGSNRARDVVTAYVSTLRGCRSPYSTGAPISRDCSSCVALVTTRDPYCFTTQWDSTCVNEARQLCQ